MKKYIRDLQPKKIKKKHCVACGTEMEVKNNNTIYCIDCKRIKELEKKRKWWNSTRP
jgi:predicted nucleic acid-binding Zn ribbon protein